MPSPGSPTIKHQLPVALTRPFPAPHQHRHFVIAADERREIALPGAAAATARTHEPEQRRRLGYAFERMRAALFRHKQAGDLALHSRGDQHRARLGQRLHPRGNVGDVAVNLAGRIYHRRAGFEPDAGAQAPACRCRRSCGSSSASARWIASAARAARSASFSCASG